MGRISLRCSAFAAMLGAVAARCWAAAETTLPGSLPLLRAAEPSSAGVPWLASVVVAAAVAGGGYLAWRRGGSGRVRGAGQRGERSLVRLSSQALTPNASVHTVAWHGQEYLVACTVQQVTLLAQRPAPGAPGGAP